MANEKDGRRVGKGLTPVEAAYLDHEGGLRRFIRRMLGRAGDVDDIAQETFLKAIAAERTSNIESPKAYLFQAARNVVLTELSKKSRQIVDYIEDAALREVPSEEPSAETHAIGRERLAMFCEALATLPPQCRKVFLMRKVQGCSHKEISKRLGISVSTVEKHLASGLVRCGAFMQARETPHQESAPLDSGFSDPGRSGRQDDQLKKRTP